MKNSKPLIFAAAILIVVIIVYIIITKAKKSRQAKANTTANENGGTAGQITSTVIETPNASMFTMKRGSDNEGVKYLKIALNYIAKKKKIEGINLVTTGETAKQFGKVTEDALYKLYRQKIVTKSLAQKIAEDSDLPEAKTIIQYLK